MIVAPNFLDHWKTRLLQTELNDDPLAPCYVLRLWAHCQYQKNHRFHRLSSAALSAICNYKGAHEVFWMAMQTSGFILVKNEVLEVKNWEEYNGSLIKSWTNGRKGGRPRKTTGLAVVPQKKPKPNHSEPYREDKIDKIDKIDHTLPEGEKVDEKPAQTPPPPKPPAPKPRNVLFDAIAEVCGFNLTEIKAEGGLIGKALADIKAATPEVDPFEIKARARRYRERWPNITLTPGGFAKHWPSLHELQQQTTLGKNLQ